MAKYLNLSSGEIVEMIPVSTSVGAADASKMIQLDAGGLISTSMLPAAALAGAAMYSLPAFEAIGAGAIINIFSDAGTPKIRNADATNGTKPPMGYAEVAIASGATGSIRLSNGIIAGMSGLVVGAKYFLSPTTPGAITVSAPTGVGNVVYKVGYAKSATEFSYTDDTTAVTLA